MTIRCYGCDGVTVRRLVTVKNWWGDHYTLVRDVPAWVCEECGEQYFDPETCRNLDALRREEPAVARRP